MPHYAAQMKRNTETGKQNTTTVKPRITGENAVRIKKLAARIGVPESQIVNFCIRAGLPSVESRWK